MEYLILIIFSLTLYSITEKINLVLFNQRNNILINLFIFSCFFFYYILSFCISIYIKYRQQVCSIRNYSSDYDFFCNII